MKNIAKTRSDFVINPSIYWKKALLRFHRTPDEVRFPAINDDGTIKSKSTVSDYKYIAHFAKSIGLDKDVLRVVNNVNSLSARSDSDEELIQTLTESGLHQVFSQLKKWGYFTYKPNLVSTFDEREYCTWHITEKGIDVGLKLQEHEDNDRRHTTTVTYSKKAFFVSLIALSLALFSASLNYKRLDLYEEELQKVQSTQTAILCNIKDNKKQ